MDVAFDVLLEHWELTAWERVGKSKFEEMPTQDKNVTKKQRLRVHEAVGDDAWLLVANASVDELSELIDCVIKLRSDGGRAQLVAAHDARMERQRDGGFEAWTHASDEDAHASLRECKLKEKAEVVLTGRGELAAAGIAGSLNGQIATVVSFSATKNKYIVRLASGCCVAAPPFNVVSTKLNLEKFVAALHGFDGAAQCEVRAI